MTRFSARIPDPHERPTLSVIEAGRVLGVGKNSAYEAVRRGEIPHIRVGHSIRIPTAKLYRKLGLVDEPKKSLPRPKSLRKVAA